ncbi:putative membrane protein [Synechococcus sp. WH 8101]|nr:putative membrane protein [Synechococcus sp. WH 8101]
MFIVAFGALSCFDLAGFFAVFLLCLNLKFICLEQQRLLVRLSFVPVIYLPILAQSFVIQDQG